MTINLNEYIGTSVAIPLAKQGEYGKEVTFDFSAWVERFGSGSIGWSIQRPQDTAAYLLPSTEDGTVSTITLTETESQYAGYGLLEVFYVNTGETEKRISKTFSFRIDKSLQNLGSVPSPWASYVDAVHADAVAAEEAASSVLDLTASATVDSNVGTPSVSVEVSTEDDHKNMAFVFSNIKGEQGETGETGNGISSVSVEKTATVDNVDTYTMTIAYTDGDSDTATFDVTNGEVTEEEFYKAFPTDTAQGSIASYPDGANMPVKDLKVSVTPVQDLSNGDPSPTNICPITGWTGANVVRTNGKEPADPDYVSNTYPFTFGQTVYGGTLDVTTGVLTITHAKVTATTSNTVRNSGTNFYVSVADSIRDGNAHTLLSNVFKSWDSSIGTGTLGICFINGSGALRFNPTSKYATVSEMLSAIGELYFVYQLASPQSVQLTPTEVKSLLGSNNIFADCGDSEVEYLADVTLYIQKLTGSTEDDMVANQNIANNKYFLVGSRLFFSTSAIAQGASIIVGTNCTETNLADALNALNS